MKDIVVAIDFSKGSVHALEYAIELANLTQANITMVWVDNLSNNELTVASDAKAIRNEAKGNFDELLGTYSSKLSPGKLTAKIRKGRVYQELATYISQNECSFLIIGTHGASGFEEYWIGTNAFRIVSSSDIPVITVKSGYEIRRGIRKILLPIYHTSQTLHKVEFTAELAKATGADINIVTLVSGGLKSVQRLVDSNLSKVKKHLDQKGVNYITDSISSDNLTSDLIQHARLVDVDLISIMTDVQDQASSVMLGAFAQQLVNYSPVPILTIHPKDRATL
jgi:nucleotide-binding universal stress UspA family protein